MAKRNRSDDVWSDDAASGDWQSRMAVRGGPVTHLLARSGWAIFATLGGLLMTWIALIVGLDPDTRPEGLRSSDFVVVALTALVPFGIVGGGLFGLLPQFIVRAWLRTPNDAERFGGTDMRAAAAKSHEPEHEPLRGRWERLFGECERCVTSIRDVVATAPKGSGRVGLRDVSDRMERELEEALRLARIGQNLESGDPDELSPTAARVEELLIDAGRAFADTSERAASIALDLRATSSFADLQARLEVLASQAPQLRAQSLG